jgi:hypothetical protein
MHLPRLRPHYAGVTATLALLFAMSGTAYAVATIADPNSVDSAAIIDGAVATVDLHDLAVTNTKLGGSAVSAGKIQTGAVSNTKIAPGAVTSGKIAPGAVTNTGLADGSVGTGKLISGAVTNGKLADGSVTHSKLGTNSVTGGNVTNGSLTLSDLRGIDESGTIHFSLAAHGCGTITFGVTGAVAGQAALLTWTGGVPSKVMTGPLKVVSSTSIIVRACNVGSTSVSYSSIGVRVITFG